MSTYTIATFLHKYVTSLLFVCSSIYLRQNDYLILRSIIGQHWVYYATQLVQLWPLSIHTCNPLTYLHQLGHFCYCLLWFVLFLSTSLLLSTRRCSRIVLFPAHVLESAFFFFKYLWLFWRTVLENPICTKCCLESWAVVSRFSQLTEPENISGQTNLWIYLCP